MTIQQLEYFLLVAETGSFSKAAERGYVSQPAISKQITLLERELEFTLFDRRYRKATLTPPGRMFYEMIAKHQTDFLDVCREAKLRFGRWNNAVWMGLPGNCSVGNLHKVLGAFQREHPELALKVDVGTFRELAVRSSGETFDLILAPKLLPGERSRVNTATLYKGRYVMILSRDHPGYREGIVPSELDGEDLYLASTGASPREVEENQRISEHCGMASSRVLILPTTASVVGAARSGLGVGIVNDLVTLPLNYGLEVLPLDEPFEMELAWREENDNPYLPALRETILSQVVITPDPV